MLETKLFSSALARRRPAAPKEQGQQGPRAGLERGTRRGAREALPKEVVPSSVSAFGARKSSSTLPGSFHLLGSGLGLVSVSLLKSRYFLLFFLLRCKPLITGIFFFKENAGVL